MAAYRFAAQIISRSAGRSATGAAAYRAAAAITDNRTGLVHDYTRKEGVLHTEILAPAGAPAWTADRATLWNTVEQVEKRKDAQLSREILLNLPHELTDAQRLELVRAFVLAEFVSKGMVADIAIHAPHRQGDDRNHHAHIMLTLRTLTAEGFGPKARDWNATPVLEQWRASWAACQNQALEAAGRPERVDHRSLDARGIDREPEPKQGPVATKMERAGRRSKAGDDRRATRARNAKRARLKRCAMIIDLALERERRRQESPRPDTPYTRHDDDQTGADGLNGHFARAAHAPFPVAAALEALTRDRSTFTRRDMARFVSRHTATAEAFRAAMAALEASPELVSLGPDDQGAARFTTRAMRTVELQMERHAVALLSRRGHIVPPPLTTRLSPEQKAARDHILSGGDLAAVIGYAGSGKSTMLGEARAAWVAAGYCVQGMALSGIAAEGLEHGAGIDSATIHKRLHQWSRGKDLPTARTVLVIDEAGMIGSRLTERILAYARRAGAKVVLVGDPAQLQAIEAGGAFRSIIRRTGAALIATIRRQHAAWQQAATRELADGQAAAALARYDAHGMLHGHGSMAEARAALIRQWDAARRGTPDETRIILAYRRDDVRDLNERARAMRRAAGELGPDHVLPSAQGPLPFAAGDRIAFLKNSARLGVRNGTLATITTITGTAVTVRLDDGRVVTFNAAAYQHITHGYAVTVHKSQGMTVDRTFLLASRNLDRHAAYVGMSRHRAAVHVHWSRDEFSDRDRLAKCFARDGFKDTSLDYDGEPFGGFRHPRFADASARAAGAERHQP